ncbi:bidirectional sugar transporter NEC1-like [Amaranthus tricolor]|uniref:bidirectional sugar transporter NEC1-like n=1 Tax=Amaranthus tricolor TaxID=29722 RepID=UPI002588E87E|nr:bidirectional sugar transporter NEC1-like [Amaranthus tricolor]
MALSPQHLHQLTFIFGILGNFVSCGVFLAPLPTFWSIYKKKSTQGFQSIPYSVALFSAMLLLYYALIKESNGMMIITINTFGFVIESFYLIVFLIYATKNVRVYTARLIGLFNVVFFGVIVAITMLFVRGNDEHTILSRGGLRENVVGWICGIFSVCVFAAPLSVMRMVIRTKSVEFMPFGLSFALTFCAVFWFFFGFLIKDYYIALPNVLGFLFGIAQMILYTIYKASSKKQKKILDLMITEGDIMQLHQELSVDIKLGKVEKKEQESMDKEPQNKVTAAESIQVIVQEMIKMDEVHNNKEIDGNLTLGNPPRGDCNV